MNYLVVMAGEECGVSKNFQGSDYDCCVIGKDLLFLDFPFGLWVHWLYDAMTTDTRVKVDAISRGFQVRIHSSSYDKRPGALGGFGFYHV